MNSNKLIKNFILALSYQNDDGSDDKSNYKVSSKMNMKKSISLYDFKSYEKSTNTELFMEDYRRGCFANDLNNNNVSRASHNEIPFTQKPPLLKSKKAKDDSSWFIPSDDQSESSSSSLYFSNESAAEYMSGAENISDYEDISDSALVSMRKLTSKSTIDLVEDQWDIMNKIRHNGLHRYILVPEQIKNLNSVGSSLTRLIKITSIISERILHMSDLNDQLDKYKTANKITMPHYLEYIDSLKWHLFDSHSTYDYLNTSKNPFSRLNPEKFSILNESSLQSSSITKDLEMINTKQAIDIINLVTSDEDEKMQKADDSANMIEEKIEEDDFNEEALNNLSFDDCVVSKDKYIPKKRKIISSSSSSSSLASIDFDEKINSNDHNNNNKSNVLNKNDQIDDGKDMKKNNKKKMFKLKDRFIS